MREELLITLRNHGIADQGTVDAILARLGLAQHADAYPRDLSVGERQRVALGAIMVTHPRALLLDEPTRGLDYAAKQRLAALLREWRSDGIATLLVTHDVEFAALLADRVILIGRGEVIADGPAATVLGASPLFAPQIARLFPGTGWLSPMRCGAGLKKYYVGAKRHKVLAAESRQLGNCAIIPAHSSEKDHDTNAPKRTKERAQRCACARLRYSRATPAARSISAGSRMRG